MKNVKMFTRIILGLIASFFLIILSVLLIMKYTILNKDYVIKKISDDNYYDKLYEEIKKDMENNTLSSGIDKEVINDIYTEDMVRDDVSGLIGSIYSGNKFEINLEKIEGNLNESIDEFLNKNNLKADDENALNNFKERIVNVYKDEVSLYGYFNNIGDKYKKVDNVCNILIALLIVIISLNLFIIRKLHKKYYGVTFLSAGLGLIYLKMFIWEGIDIKNIIIISDSFSNVLKNILNDIGTKLLTLSIIFIILGIILNITSSFKKIKRIRRT